jgi:hypothetical protein
MSNKYMLIGVGIVVGVLLASVVVVLAGNIDSPAGPTAASGQMYTLEQIYDRLNDGTAATKMTTFTEPSSGPGSTMHTLDEIYDLIGERAPVPKTGQTTKYADGDDGDLQKGVSWPTPRFTDNSDGTVTDNLTGLIWLEDANCTDTVGGIDKTTVPTLTWTSAITWSNNLADGYCGLSDGSIIGDWRLPNVRELFSLIDYSQKDPALPSGHPFDNVQSDLMDCTYWSSTTDPNSEFWAATVRFFNSGVGGSPKTESYYVWPVRGGQ